MRHFQIIALRVGLLIALLGSWELATGGWLFPAGTLDVYFSSPSHILAALVRERGTLLSDAILTLSAAFGGLIAGTVTGLVGGALFARFSLLDKVLEPFLQAMNAIPRPALAPLMVIWFGLGLTSKVVLSWSIVFFIIFYNVYAGVKAIDPDYIRAVQVMGATRRHVLKFVVIPSTLSWVFAAFRVCVAYSLLGAVVGEFAGASAGLGYRLIAAQGLLQSDLLYAIIFILMGVGYALTALSRAVEDRLLRWRPPSNAF